jgi:lipoprotein-anchoring transpeptidase ErfK/SrfK
MTDFNNPIGGDPIDQYLTRLNEVQQTLDKEMPRLEQGINSIMGDTQRAMIPNVMPVAPNMHKELGSYAGMTNFNNPVPKVQNNSSVNLVKSLIGELGVPGAIPQSDAAYLVRKVGFGNGPGRQNFDRYHNHPSFDRLGWNPYMDMETLYNDNSSWTEDLRRAGGQWFGLAGIGMRQMASNWDNLLSADTSGDAKYAAEMNRRMAIASSSRGGVGGFLTNQVANSGYTFGVVGEILAEELALAAATFATEGAGLPAAMARTGQNLNKLFKLGDFATDASKLAKAGKTVDDMRSTSGAFNAVNNVSSARKFWEGIKTNAKAAYEFSKPGLDFANPFSNTADAVRAFKTDAKGFAKLTDFAANSGSFGAFFKDAQGLNAALAESRLEGGFVQNEVLNNLLGEHYKKSAAPPTDSEAQAMISQAKAAGVMTTGMNIPAILYSNKIVFDKLFSGYRGFKDGPNPLGTMVRNYGAKKGEKAYAGFFDKGSIKDWGTLLKSGGIARQYVKNGFRPTNLAKHGLRYLSANLTEGLQEVYQEAASAAMTDYYTNTFSSPERAGNAEFASALGRGIEAQFTGQGLETFASGFLMGGLVQGPQTLLTQTAPQAFKDVRTKMKDPAAYAASEKRRAEDKTNITNFMNSVAADPRKYYDPIYGNVKAQKDFATVMTEADDSNNKKAHGDAAQDSLFEHVSTLINRGYVDLFTDQISEFEKLTDNELMDAFGLDKKDIESGEYRKDLRARLKSVKEKVDGIQKRYDKYASVRNPYNRNSKDEDEQLDYLGFEKAKDVAIFNEYTFDRAESRMNSILNNAANAGLGGVLSGKITSVLAVNPLTLRSGGYAQINAELKALQSEYETYQNGTAEQKELAKQKKVQIDALTELKAGLDSFSFAVNAARSVNDTEVAKEVSDTVHAVETVTVGDEVEYTPKKKKAIKGKVVKRGQSRVTIEYTENGKTKRTSVNINGKTLSITGKTKPSQTTLNFDPNDKTKNVEFMRESLGADIRSYLAAISGLDKNSVQLDKLVADMLDYYELAEDAHTAANFVNTLNNPEYFAKTVKMLRDSHKAAYAKARQTIADALDSYKKRAEVNKILQDVFEKYQIFFLPAEVERLLNGEGIPMVFFDSNTLDMLDPAEAKYAEIRKYLLDWAKKAGFYAEPTQETPTEETGTKPEVKPEEKVEPEPVKITKQITQDTPLGDMPTELVNQLRVQFSRVNRDRIMNDMSEISEEDFPKWVSEDAKALLIINTFNTRNGLGPVAPKEKAGKVTEFEVSFDINRKSSKEEVIAAIENAPDEIVLREIQNKITDALLENTGLAPEEINSMISKRAGELERENELIEKSVEAANFDTIREGAGIFMKNAQGANGRGVVTKIVRGENPSITLSIVQDFRPKEITLSREEFENQVETMMNKSDYEVRQEMRAGKAAPEAEVITPEEQEVSNENIKATDTEDAIQLDSEADKLSDELGIDAAKENLINKLGCKK